MPYGRTLLTNSILNPTRVSADGNPRYKVGGITLDLTTLPAAVSGSDVTLPDGSIIKIGAQYLRYGQVLTQLGVAEVQTVTFTGGPTAGSAIITLPASGNEPAQTMASVAFDETAVSFATKLQALGRIGPNGATVARTGAGTNGDPYIYTITFNRSLGDVPQLTSTHTFTGGTTPTTTHATGTAGSGNGKYGPYDPAATDGRQTLVRGRAFVLDETYVVNPSGAGLPASNDIIGGVFDDGLVWFDRLLQSNLVTGTLALGPTLANFETVFPNITYVKP